MQCQRPDILKGHILHSRKSILTHFKILSQLKISGTFINVSVCMQLTIKNISIVNYFQICNRKKKCMYVYLTSFP